MVVSPVLSSVAPAAMSRLTVSMYGRVWTKRDFVFGGRTSRHVQQRLGESSPVERARQRIVTFRPFGMSRTGVVLLEDRVDQ